MIISISQPTLFPWLGYFDMIDKSDIFVFLDNVKFEKKTKISEFLIMLKYPIHGNSVGCEILMQVILLFIFY